MIAVNVMEFNESKYLLTNEELHIVAYIDIVTSLLSLIGATSIVFAAIKKKGICLMEVHPIFQLSCADLIASLALCLSTVLFLIEDKYGLHAVCPWMISIVTAFYVTTFLMTMLYALELVRRMHMRRQGIIEELMERKVKMVKFHWMGLAYVVAWVVPITIAILYMLIPGPRVKSDDLVPMVPYSYKCQSCLAVFHYNEVLCWSDDEQIKDKNLVAKTLFLIPLTLVILLNFVFYILVIYCFRRAQDYRGMMSITAEWQEYKLRNKAILYQGVFILCWLPSLILGFISLSSAFNMKQYMWLYTIQACLCPLQGFFNSIIYGWKRKGFLSALSWSGDTIPLTSSEVPSYSTYSI